MMKQRSHVQYPVPWITRLLLLGALLTFAHSLPAQGVQSQDSLALVDLYNSTNGAGWANNTHWLSSSPISTWYGVTITGDRVTNLDCYQNNLSGSLPSSIGDLTAITILDLGGNNLSGTVPVSMGNLVSVETLFLDNNALSGSVPAEFANLSNLQYLYLNGNQLTDLPDLSGLANLSMLYAGSNRLDFGDIEPNIGILTFTYEAQDSAGASIDTAAVRGSNITLSAADVGGGYNLYQWYKDGNPISGATGVTYTITSVGNTDVGEYTCEITNSVVSDLTLWHRTISLSFGTFIGNTAALYVRGYGTARALDSAPVNTTANTSAYQITGYNLTVEAWVFLTDLPANGTGYRIVTRPYPNAPFESYSLFVSNFDSYDSPRYAFEISDGTSRIAALDPSPPQTGTWVHLAGTYDGTYVRLYVNGTLVATTPFSQPISLGQDAFYIGSRYNYNPTQGLIDEVRIWNTARSQTDIQNSMYSSLAGNESGLMGYWSFNTTIPYIPDPSFAVVEDQTMNHNDLILFEGADLVDQPVGTSVELSPEVEAATLDGAVGELLTHTPAVHGWPAPTLSLTQAPSGLGLSGYSPGDSVTWTPDRWQTEWNQFILQAENSAGTAAETFRVWVNPVPVHTMEHSTGVATLGVLNNGIFGKMDDLGAGFLYNGTNGLYEGTLILGQSETQVSGALYTREFGTAAAIQSVTSDLSGFDQAYVTEFYDGRAPDPLGVTVRQRSYSSSTAPDQSYVILEYTLVNTTSADLTGIYAGLLTDWDVGDYTQNLASSTTDHRLSYVYDASGGITNYYGDMLLTGQVTGHVVWPSSVNAGSSDSVQYAGLTTIEPAPASASDIRSVVGTGPYDIPAGDSVTVAFALVAGTDMADIRTNAGYALNTYLSTPPAAPFHLTATPRNQEVQVSWKPNTEPDLGAYRIYRRTGSTLSTLIGEVSGQPPDTVFTDTGLTNGTSYWYKITAVDSLGNESEFSAKAGATPVDITAPPRVKWVWPQPDNLATITDTLMVLFDRPMDASTLDGNISVTGNRGGTESVSILTADSIVGIVPDGRFTSMDYLTVRLGAGIRDIWGNTLDGNGNGTPEGTPTDDYRWSVNVSAAGDFNRDHRIDFDDLMYFQSAWLAQPQKSWCELYPFTGSVPYLKVAPDGVLNFDDMMVLARMWNWGMKNLSKPVAKPAPAKVATAESPLRLAAHWNTTGDEWTPVGQQDFSLELRLREDRPLAGLACTIQMDPEVLTYHALEKSDSLGSGDHNWVFLDSYDEQTHQLTLNMVNFGAPGDGEHPISLLGRIDATILKETDVTLQGWVDVRVASDSTQNYRRQVRFAVNTARPGPEVFELRQNFPNPFRAQTTIRYAVPVQADVSLTVYDMQGQVVKSFVQGIKPPGYYTEVWNGTNDAGFTVSSGMYFVVFRTPKRTFRKKIVFVK